MYAIHSNDDSTSGNFHEGRYSYVEDDLRADAAALMVMEHQIHVQNLLTRVNCEVRTLLYSRSERTGRARGPSPGGGGDVEARCRAAFESEEL